MNLKTIIKLMDLKTLVAGIVTVVLGSVYSLYAFRKFNLVYFIMLLIAMILVQSSTNMINDYFDFKRGADSNVKEDEKALVSGEATPKQVILIVAIYRLIALVIGVFIASQTSYFIILVAVIGDAISYLYASGPLPISYTPLGEITSGTIMGIGITTTVIYIQSGMFSLNTVLVAIPTAIFIGTVMLSNNLSDIAEDRDVGRKTLPVLIGVKNAERLWIFDVVLLLVLTIVLLVLRIYPIYVLIAVIIFYPYKTFAKFLSYEKSVQTKGRTMGLIGEVGLRYHLALIIGLIVSSII